MNLKERLTEAEAKLTEVKTAVENGESSADELAEAIANVKSAQANIKAAEEAETLIKSLGAEKEAPAETEKTEMEAKSLGENFVNVVKDMELGKKFNVAAPAFTKAAADTQGTPAVVATLGTDAYASTFDTNVVEATRTPLVIRDLFGAETISGSTLVYLVEGAIEGAPAATEEGKAKPQVHFADPTLVTVSLDKIACHIKESDEYINDYPFLASAINGRLLNELGLVEQNKLVSELITNSDVQTGEIASGASATDIAEAILKAAMDVQEQSGFAADAVIINPADWYTLRVAKNDNGYFGGGFFGAQDIPNLWGYSVCVSTAVSAGTYVVGAFKTCGSVVSKGGVSVEAANTDQDDFIKNLMTIRAEERLALAVRRPKGFKVLTQA